jgi:endo-1,4-beta-xylanase
MHLSLLLIAPLVATTIAQKSGLHASIKSKGKKYFGTCADRSLLQNSQNAAVITAEFGQLTAENSMKWDATEPQRGTFRFDNSDFLVNWAVNRSMLVRGHTTVWHSQLPQWVKNVNDKATLSNIVTTHVSGLVGRWKGKIFAWVRYAY